MSTLGKAISLNQVGDLKLTQNDAGNTDVDIIEDTKEVAQALVIRFRTRRGEDPISPRTGLPIPEIMGVFDNSLLNTILRTELQKDGRIKAIRRVATGLQDREDRHKRAVQGVVSTRLINNEAVTITERFVL